MDDFNDGMEETIAQNASAERPRCSATRWPTACGA